MGIWQGQNFLIRINNQVPDPTQYPGIWPERPKVNHPAAAERTLNGAPVGFAGFPSAVLSWQFGMSAIAYSWWLSFTTTSVTLTDLVLPDPEQGTDVVHNFGGSIGNKTYLLHGQWDSAIMERITAGVGSYAIWLNGRQWVTGPLSVRLWGIWSEG